jgi:hypothetical protein
MRAVYALVATMLIQATAPQVPLPERVVDLLAVPPPAPERESSQGCGCAVGGASHSDQSNRPNAKVTLVQISPEAFGVGDNIVLELLVENVGRTRIPIALTRDPDLAPSCHMAGTDVSTAFALFAENGSQVVSVSPRFSGSFDVAGTAINLEAGERLRVRVPATAEGIDQTRPLSEDPQTLKVEASFHSQLGRCGSLFVRSRNALAAQVSLPR